MADSSAEHNILQYIMRRLLLCICVDLVLYDEFYTVDVCVLCVVLSTVLLRRVRCVRYSRSVFPSLHLGSVRAVFRNA